VTESKLNKCWAVITGLLIVVIAISGTVAWLRYEPSRPLEISLLQTPVVSGKIYITGAVSNPGFYPLTGEDTVASLIQAVGGTAQDADISQLTLYIPRTGDTSQPQKIDLNRAEAWLLKALPEIGESRAEAIVAYRQQNGPLSNITELVKVEGIGITTFEKIKHLITVVD
jgi:competence protein ComEA